MHLGTSSLFMHEAHIRVRARSLACAWHITDRHHKQSDFKKNTLKTHLPWFRSRLSLLCKTACLSQRCPGPSPPKRGRTRKRLRRSSPDVQSHPPASRRTSSAPWRPSCAVVPPLRASACAEVFLYRMAASWFDDTVRMRQNMAHKMRMALAALSA